MFSMCYRFLKYHSSNMGIVIGVVIDVVVTAAATAAEAATTAALEAAAAAAEGAAEASIEAAAEAAAEEAAEGAAEAAAEGAEETATEAEAEAAAEADPAMEASKIVERVLKAIQKLAKFSKEFYGIDAVFKVAKIILDPQPNPRPSHAKTDKIEKLINILIAMKDEMGKIQTWIEDHKEDTAKLEGIEVSVDTGVLSKFIAPLAGVGIIKVIISV